MGIHVAADEASRILARDELASRLERIGAERYHHQHAFHLRMHEGRLTPGQLQAWALNRYYYQSRVPMKDAIILSRSEDPGFRRAWRKRIVDHDGQANGGGLECWIQLAEATGLPRKRVTSCAEVLPAVRYAVDAYLALVERGTLLEAVASSLTELFASRLIAVRLDALRGHYPRLLAGLEYFEARLSQAPEDARFAFEWVCEHARTREDQELAARALIRKCEILWTQLDALYFAYVEPGWPPPGAFRPESL
jgi:coenzyme PQQ biosynthesis protein C